MVILDKPMLHSTFLSSVILLQKKSDMGHPEFFLPMRQYQELLSNNKNLNYFDFLVGGPCPSFCMIKAWHHLPMGIPGEGGFSLCSG